MTTTSEGSISIQSGWLIKALDHPRAILASARSALANVDYDTLVGTGLSGALVLPLLGLELGKHILIVRKPGERGHSASQVEGTLGHRWVFVDDFINTGATMRRVKDAVDVIARSMNFTADLVGSFLYTDGEYIHYS